MVRLGLILDLHMLKTYNLKDSDKSQRSRKESYIKGNGAFTFDFHLVCHIELYCCCFYFLTMSAKNTLSEKRPSTQVFKAHTESASSLCFGTLFVACLQKCPLFHFNFQCTSKRKKMLKWINLII